MRRRATATGLAVTLAFGLGLAGCGQEEGPGEQMGKAIDETMKDATESARGAAEEMRRGAEEMAEGAARTAEEAAAAARKAAGDVAAGPDETVEDYE